MKFLKRTHGVSKLGKEDMTSLYNMATEQETLPVQAEIETVRHYDKNLLSFDQIEPLIFRFLFELYHHISDLKEAIADAIEMNDVDMLHNQCLKHLKS